MWLFKKQQTARQSTMLTTLYCQNNQLSLLAGKNNATNQFNIHAFANIPENQLKDWVKKNLLQQSPTTIILPTSNFELHLLEALSVADNEIHSALRWRLKDLINYPVQEACWDYFQIPTNDARKYILGVVVCHTEQLTKMVADITASTLKINTITIRSEEHTSEL